MKHLTPERAFWLLSIIALLILLKRCGGERDQYKEERDKTHTLRRQLQDDTAAYSKQVREYMALMHQEQQKQVVLTKRADSIDKTRKVLEREIKSLYSLLKQPYDTTIIDSTCCSLANQLVSANEAHRSDDSAKDAAMLVQLDVATERIDTLSNQLARANSRFIQRDEIPISKPRGAVWFGVETNIGPASSGGLYLRYATPWGKEYGVAGGFQPQGWYLGAKIGQKISFRKKRKG